MEYGRHNLNLRQRIDTFEYTSTVPPRGYDYSCKDPDEISYSAKKDETCDLAIISVLVCAMAAMV